MNRLKKVKLKDILSILILILAIPIAIINYIYRKLVNKPLWLICELENTCRDNGYHFFKYMRKEHPDFDCYYAINMKSNDYNKIKDLGNIVEFGSFKHWVMYLSSEYNISTHKEGNPNHAIFTFIHLILHLKNNRVFLQHGITKDNVPMFYYKNTYFKYFICGAKKEYEYIRENFGYPGGNVVYTGFARFDNLHHIKSEKEILVIPTWRRWFELSDNKKEFMSSEYYKRWNNFLNNEKLNDILEQYDVKLLFYPHYQMRKYIDCFQSDLSNIRIVIDKDVQDLLKKAALMITDYSSVYMDFAYMQKPIIYYQFDYKKYRSSHLSEGYFNYTRNGFGKIIFEEDIIVKEIKKYLENNFCMEDMYRQRAKDFFEIHDKKNCERIFNVLIKNN